MIKLEHKFLPEKGILAFKAEASREEDLKTLDLLMEAIFTNRTMKAGFSKSDTLIVHVEGMDKKYFEEESSLN